MRFTTFKPLNAFTLVLFLTPTFSYGKLPEVSHSAGGTAEVRVSTNNVNTFLRELFRCRDQMTGSVFAGESSKTDFPNKCLGPYAIKTASNSLQDCSARLLKLAEAKGLSDVDMNLSFRYLSMCRKSNILKIPAVAQPVESTVEL